MTKVKNPYNNWDLVPEEPGEVVFASVQPVTIEEAAALGTTVETTKRVIGRGPWPGGVHSVVEWGGRTWDAKGEPREYLMSKRTKHFDIIMRAQTAEVK